MDFYNNSQVGSNGVTLQKFMAKTFLWMFLGLAITFGIAFMVSTNITLTWKLMFLFGNITPFIYLIAQIGVVIALSARIMRIKHTTAIILFVLYSILTGITFSILPIAYGYGELIMAFAITTIYFGSLAFIGYTTHADLSKIGTICTAALMALVIYTLLGIVFRWSTDSYLFAVIGLLIFTGLTAWDVQKTKRLYYSYQGDVEMEKKLSIYSALDLYLDFINIFLYVLRFIGNKD